MIVIFTTFLDVVFLEFLRGWIGYCKVEGELVTRLVVRVIQISRQVLEQEVREDSNRENTISLQLKGK